MIIPISPARGIYISKSKISGRGVFASRSFKAGECIEEAPVILLSESETKELEQKKINGKNHILRYYIFQWGKNKKQSVIALGFVSIYNHSFDSNAEYVYNKTSISIIAVKDINIGEEIFTNYNGNKDNKQPLWFKTK